MKEETAKGAGLGFGLVAGIVVGVLVLTLVPFFLCCGGVAGLGLVGTNLETSLEEMAEESP